MREIPESTGLLIHIYGPETHMTAMVPLALGLENFEDFPEFDDESHTTKKKKLDVLKENNNDDSQMDNTETPTIPKEHVNHIVENISASARCFVYGLQQRAIQGILDFDFMNSHYTI